MRVFSVADVLDAETCAWVRESMDSGAHVPAEILRETIDVEHDARRAIEVDVPDEVIARVESCLDACRDDVAGFYGLSLHGREGAGFLRYASGGFYGPHVDRARVPSWPDAARRAITVVLFLNSSCEAEAHGDFSGGRLRLFPSGVGADAVEIIPRRGTLVAFPASMAHEVTPVSGGARDAVVDWYY